MFDNAENGEQMRPWLPQGNGHVIITSRSAAFAGVASPVGVDVFTRTESISVLKVHLPTLLDGDADRVGYAVGDLPLALAQAAGLMAGTGMTVEEYLAELDGHAAELLSESPPVGYPVSLAAAVAISVGRLEGVDQAAVQLLHLCATLAPDPIPLAWLGTAPDGALPAPLAHVTGGVLAFRRTLGRLADLGLARVTGDSVQLHRLTRAVLRDQRTPQDRTDDRQQAEQLLTAAEPDDNGRDPAFWPAWAALVPHLLALDPATAGGPLRSTACNALRYLLMRGDTQIALPLAQAWHRHWQANFGPDDQHVLRAAHQVATAYRYLGHYDEARRLHEDALARWRRILGEDHPNTLRAANNLANDLRRLGEYEQAGHLDEDTLARKRRVLGDDHPDTLRSANNFAADLRQLGEAERAQHLDEDTLARRRRVLGDDHPDTLTSANNFAADLRQLGEAERAQHLDEDTLARRRRVLGDDHPDTLTFGRQFRCRPAAAGRGRAGPAP